ncbi:MAG: hypothetical protein QOE90_1130 [Thermoplasmata archaeon]|jgi:hypothetical protein|nr:hypothetical protein [Thermoplasmata archaeon]
MKLLQDPKPRGWLAVGLVAALALIVLSPFVLFPAQRHLSAYAEGAEDASHVRGELSAWTTRDVLTTPSLLSGVKDPGKTLLLVMGAERRYDASEAEAIVSFLRAGGHVILADEGGFGTAVAREAGFAFDNSRVLDSSNYHGDPKLVVANSTLAGRTYRILFNAPTAIVALPDATGLAPQVLARSTAAAAFPESSYRDLKGNGQIDIADPTGPFDLVVRTDRLGGTLVLVADTGLFMNGQVDLGEFENGAYVRALVNDILPRDGTILIDESRHAPHPGLAPLDDAARALGRVTSGDLVTYAAVALLVLAAAVAVAMTRATEDWSHHDHTVDHVVAAPESLRPDLERAQRLARRRISEKHNIPMEQVAAMSAEQLLAVCGDAMLANAAAGTLRADPSPLFRSYAAEAIP